MKGGSGKGGGRNKESLAYKKGLWTPEEDSLLSEYVKVHGKGKWNRIPRLTGLLRCGKGCRLRWMNYLNPDIRRDEFTPEEDDLIIRLHKLLGNRWSLIAGRVPGRTDNQVKNHWNTNLRKKLDDKTVNRQSSEKSMDKVTVNSIVSMEFAKDSGRGPIKKLKAIKEVTKSSSMEVFSEEKGVSIDDQHSQSPLLFFSEDDSLIFDNESLLDFLSEYSLDHTWNTIF